MTLVDSRPGIAATYRELSARTGVPIDADAAVTRLGPPLEQEIARWYPAEQVPAMTALYRELYPRYAIEPTVPLPGAYEAIRTVRAAGGSVVVVTAKHPAMARLHLDHLGLTGIELVGLAWGDGKAAALRRYRARAYVGDHVADVAAARAASLPADGVAGRPGVSAVTAVAVATGPCTAGELAAAGAEVVLGDLTGFGEWFARWVPGERIGVGTAATDR